MDVPVDLGAVRGARATIAATLQAHPEIGERTRAFLAGELEEGPMAEDKVTRIRADLVERAGEVRDKLNERTAGPWRVTQKAVLEEAIRIGLDALEMRPPAPPPALSAEAPTSAPAPPAALPRSRPRSAAPMTPPATVGGVKLRDWRDAERVSQTAVAEQLGIGQSSLSAIEVGKRAPTAEQAELLRELTGIAPEDWTTPNPEAEEE